MSILQELSKNTALATGMILNVGASADIATHSLTLSGPAIKPARQELFHLLSIYTHSPELARSITSHVGNISRSAFIMGLFLIASEPLHIRGVLENEPNLVKISDGILLAGLLTNAVVNIAWELHPATRETVGDVGFGITSSLLLANTVRGITLTIEQNLTNMV